MHGYRDIIHGFLDKKNVIFDQPCGAGLCEVTELPANRFPPGLLGSLGLCAPQRGALCDVEISRRG